MARTKHSAEDFDDIAVQLAAGIEKLNSISGAMRNAELPHALIHGSAARNVYIPAILDWIEKANAEANMQIRAYGLGIQSKAEFQKQKNENAKIAAAKKPWTKKATKKKTT